jgi:hypothetical protein
MRYYAWECGSAKLSMLDDALVQGIDLGYGDLGNESQCGGGIVVLSYE